MKIKVDEKGIDPTIKFTPETSFESSMLRQCNDILILTKKAFDLDDGTMTFDIKVPAWFDGLKITSVKNQDK